MALLEVNDLTVRYHKDGAWIDAVNAISLSLDRGKSIGLVGESGCGKTTIGMAIMGLLPANAWIPEGQIYFDGQNLLAIPESAHRLFRWKKIAMIFQAAMNALNPLHRVADQVAEAIRIHEPNLGEKEITRRIQTLFHMVGIPEIRMRDYPHQYSGGMKQRAVIAMALACQPEIIIADEPTTALDVIVQKQILDALKTFQDQFDLGILFISHDIGVVAEICHEIGVMYAGQFVEWGSRNEVLLSPAHPYTRSLLAAYPTLEDSGQMADPLVLSDSDTGTDPCGCRFRPRCHDARAQCRGHKPDWIPLSPTHKTRCVCQRETFP